MTLALTNSFPVYAHPQYARIAFTADRVADIRASAWALEYANMRTLDLVRCEECGTVLQPDDTSRLVCDTCLGAR